MAETIRLYTAAEAGAVSGLGLKAVHNAIDKHIVEPVANLTSTKLNGVRTPRFLTDEDLVRLRVWRGVGDTLSADRRRSLFLTIAAKPRAKTVKAGDLLIVDLHEARKQVERGVRDLQAAEALIVKHKNTMGGEPIIKGTRIPAYGIAEMIGAGATIGELLSGYPKLTPRILELVRVWVAAHPRRGRPKSLQELGLSPISSMRVPLKADPMMSDPGPKS